jgi:hypothetical protein
MAEKRFPHALPKILIDTEYGPATALKYFAADRTVRVHLLESDTDSTLDYSQCHPKKVLDWRRQTSTYEHVPAKQELFQSEARRRVDSPHGHLIFFCSNTKCQRSFAMKDVIIADEDDSPQCPRCGEMGWDAVRPEWT